MALNWQIINVPLGAGVDTKRSPLTVRPDKSLTLENAVLRQIDTAQKRHGYEALSRVVVESAGGRALTAGHTLGSDGDRLFMVGQQSYGTVDATNGPTAFARIGTPENTWMDAGNLQPVTSSLRSVGKQSNLLTRHTVASANGYLCHVVKDGNDVYASVFTLAGELVLDRLAVVTAALAAPKVVAVGNAFLIYWVDGVNIRRAIIDTANLSGGIGATVLVYSDADGQIDVAPFTASAGLFAYTSSTLSGGVKPIRMFSIAEDGTATSLAVIEREPRGAFAVFKTTDGTTDRICVASQWAGTGNVEYWIRATDGTAVNGPTVLTSAYAAVTIAAITGVEEPSASATASIRFFIGAHADVAIHTWQILTIRGTFAGAVAGSAYIMRGVRLVSNAWLYKDRAYVLTAYCYTDTTTGVTNAQPTYFVKSIRSEDGADDANTDAVVLPRKGGGSPWGVSVSVSSVVPLADGRFLVGGFRHDLPSPTGISNYIIGSPIAITLDYEPGALPTAQLGDGIFLGGGVVQAVDGRFAEYNFLIFPENPSYATAAGNVPDGTYLYRFVYEATDLLGRRLWSAISPAFTVTKATGGNNSIVLTVPTLKECDKDKAALVRVYAYRTITTGSTYYKTASAVGSDGGTVNNKTADTITITDDLTDTQLTNRQQLYTNGGVLEDACPPPTDVLMAGKGRLWAVDAGDPATIWFTKYLVAGELPRFSVSLTKRISSGGAVTTLGFWGEAVIVFQERSIRYFTGPGPNDLGQPAGDMGFSEDFLLSLDVGCTDRASLVACDRGLIFKSHRGFYIVAGPGGPPAYIGADVEAYNGYTVTSAVLVETAHQVRFGLKDGPTLVYDYLVGQWSTFTNHPSVSACLWQGKYAWLDAGGRVHVENDGYYDANDTPISLKWGTGWIRLSGLQDFEMCTRAYILGSFKSHHKLKLSAYVEADGYDPQVVADSGILNTEDALSVGTGLYKFEHALAVQKFSAVRFEIEDIDPKGTGEGYSISGLALKVGLLPGVHRGAAAMTL